MAGVAGVRRPAHSDGIDSLGLVEFVSAGLRRRRGRALEEALAIRRKALPKDHPDIADSLNNLGAVQYDLREYAAAKASHEEALAIRRRALPTDHPDIADSLNNLGNVQSRSAGVRGGEEELRGGAGHPPQGPARGPPRHRRQPEQPGDRAVLTCGSTRRRRRATRRRWPSAARPCPRTTPTSPRA